MARCSLCSLLLAVCFSSGCSFKYHGAFRSDGFYYKRYGYSVCFVDKDDKTFINKDWEVDNYTLNHLRGTFKIKKSKRYLGFKIVDRNQDGILEKEDAYRYDLKLDHIKTPAVIWIQTFELQPHHAAKKLEVFAKSYADSLQATGEYRDGNPYHKLKMKKEYKVTIEGKQYLKLKGNPALVATIQIRDLLRLKADPKHEGTHIVVVLAKMTSLEDAAVGATTLLVVGYYNTAKFFSGQLQNFYRFLDRIRFTTTTRCK